MVTLAKLLIGVLAIFSLESTQHAFVPHDIQRVLDGHVDDLEQRLSSLKHPRKKTGDGVWQFSWLPDHFVKYDVQRIFGAKKIRSCIDRYHLDLITVPDKRLYHLKGRPKKLSKENYLVIVKKITPASDPQPLNKEQVRQLSILIKKGCFDDLHSTNYLQTPDGKLCIIDTEATFDKKRRIKGFLRLIGTGHNLNTDYTQEALNYLFHEIQRYLEKEPERAAFVFKKLGEYFSLQKEPPAWNYVNSCYKLLKEYRPSEQEIKSATFC